MEVSVLKITHEVIQVAEVIESVLTPMSGAIVPFIGRVRAEPGIKGLQYEVYATMALKQFKKICSEASQQWPLEGISIVHRAGWVPVGEIAVAIAVSSEHRPEAFAACRYVIEQIKKLVPIWKEGEVGQSVC